MAEDWLLIETSGRVGQVGLGREGAVVQSRRLDEARRHARDLAAKVAEMLQTEGLEPADVAGVMVSIGPGSYTGLRVGIASAKTFAYATGCPLIAVPTFAAIAMQAPPDAKMVCVIADGLQGLVYRQEFETGRAASELRIERAAETLPFTPGCVSLTGPGIDVYAGLLPAHASLVSERDREPSLIGLFQAGQALLPVTRQELFALEPLYLRGSSAEEKAKANEPRD